MHSLDKFLTGDLLFAVLIQLIDKLRTVLYHLVHGHLLGEMTILEAILAIVVVDRAIGMLPAVLILGQRHTLSTEKRGEATLLGHRMV